jgi:hypothetical protein
LSFKDGRRDREAIVELLPRDRVLLDLKGPYLFVRKLSSKIDSSFIK